MDRSAIAAGPRPAARTASSARHHEWTTDKRGNGPSFHRRGPARPLRLHRSRAAAPPPWRAASARHHEWTTDRTAKRPFFTVTPGLARFVSIAAGRGAAAPAAASARHQARAPEWTIGRRETAGFRRRGRGPIHAVLECKKTGTLGYTSIRSMIPKSDHRFSEKIMLNKKVDRDDDSKRSPRALCRRPRASPRRAKRLAVRGACVHLRGAAKGPMRVAT